MRVSFVYQVLVRPRFCFFINVAKVELKKNVMRLVFLDNSEQLFNFAKVSDLSIVEFYEIK